MRPALTDDDLRVMFATAWTTKVGDCWEWNRCRTEKGYGKQGYRGRTVRAHRLAYYLHHGVWPTTVRHTCDNPCCVRPFHLIGGTNADNTADMMARGRSWTPPRKLTPGQEDEIRLRYTPYRGVSALAEEFGITRRRLNKIIHRT